MLNQLVQITLANVLQVSKHIKLNMVKEKVVTIGFNKDTLWNSSANSS
jgi:hypothetical protein